jgi:branched-chain amino acid transport system ATP-binding protein
MLSVQNLTVRFGSFVAVNDVACSVAPGSVLGVMGVNGAGKSTLLNCISGILPASAGSVTCDGADLTGMAAHMIVRNGLARTFQIPRCFRGLTCLENLLVVPHEASSSGDLRRQAMEALARVRLDKLSDHYAEELSGGQQKLLEFARLTMADPRYILLDEPFAGMHPDLCRQLTHEIEELVAEGKGIVLVSHDPETLYRLSSEIIVMNQGKIICRGDAQVVRGDPQVIEAYLGPQAQDEAA